MSAFGYILGGEATGLEHLIAMRAVGQGVDDVAATALQVSVEAVGQLARLVQFLEGSPIGDGQQLLERSTSECQKRRVLTMSTVLITGCSTGIGRAAAKKFQAEGWNVVATMRNVDDGAELEGDGVLVTRLDLLDTESIDAAVKAAVSKSR